MSAELKVCDISEEAKEKMKKFRFRKTATNAALIFKINDLTIDLDEEHDDISIEELQAELPSSQPRYVVLSYVYKHDDGRISYPLMFFFISPTGCKPEQQMKYAGSKNLFVNSCQVSKVFELRNVEELTEEYLKEKLAFFR